jgi:putative IMPACT (imprinted ancient) family translation regulator
VVRYFGGTKLGVGPLGKAYGESALELLKSSKLIELTKFEKIAIHFNYDEINSVHYLINKYDCQKINNVYNETPCIECLIEPFLISNFHADLIEKSNGKAYLESKNKTFYLRLN